MVLWFACSLVRHYPAGHNRVTFLRSLQAESVSCCRVHNGTFRCIKKTWHVSSCQGYILYNYKRGGDRHQEVMIGSKTIMVFKVEWLLFYRWETFVKTLKNSCRNLKKKIIQHQRQPCAALATIKNNFIFFGRLLTISILLANVLFLPSVINRIV